MKNLLATFSLVLALICSFSISANEIGPIVLESEQLDDINGGVAFALSQADASAAGVFLSLTSSVTSTVAVSVIGGGLSASGSNSQSSSLSLAF